MNLFRHLDGSQSDDAQDTIKDLAIFSNFGVVQNVRPCGSVFFGYTFSEANSDTYMHTYMLLPLLETLWYTTDHTNACQTYSLPRYIIKCKIKYLKYRWIFESNILSIKLSLSWTLRWKRQIKIHTHLALLDTRIPHLLEISHWETNHILE